MPVNLSSLGPGMAWLRAGDAFVWVGPKQHGAAPWARLRKAGVRTIYYQTEALDEPGCWVPPNRHPTPVGKRLERTVDEIWDYSASNVELCARHPNAPRLRHVPPVATSAADATGGAAPPRTPAAPSRSPRRAIFLGDVTLGERARCLEREPRLRALIEPVNNIWDAKALAALLARDGPDAPPPVFVSLHKRCLAAEAHSPAEAFRLSPLLEAGARVVAQRSHPRDEAFYDGAAVTFAPLSALANTVAAELATPDSPADAAKRAAAFRRAFDVGDAFRRFGLIG